MNIFQKLKDANFIDLGFAVWESGKGLQIQNLDFLDKEAPGVYVMHYNKLIQKVGKSSASLVSRLSGYRGFDKDSRLHDRSSKKQRQFVQKWSIPGLYVMALQPTVSIYTIPGLEFTSKCMSFDPHDLEKNLKKICKIEHPLEFGS